MTSTQEQIEISYDVSNEFFRLWLDENMHYTSATYLTGDETLEQAGQRLLQQEVGVDLPATFTQLGVFDAPHRDPRTRVISVALQATLPEGVGASNTASGAWFAVDQVVGPLAFDHDAILARVSGAAG